MKKILAILVSMAGIVSSLFFVSASPSIEVTAVVDAINHSPVVVSLMPASDPKLLGRNRIQNYTLYFRDDEREAVTYTITPVDGYANPINGSVSPASYDSASGAYVNFTYLAPATVPAGNLTKVTVSLNDGTNLVTKDINLYIY